MQVEVLSLFPAMCEGPLNESMMRRAQAGGKVQIRLHDLRNWAAGPHRITDDTPYGGGPGMVLKVEPIYKALAELRQPDSHVIYFSPQGRRLDQSMASHAAGQLGHVILLCGHYEGVDQRVIDHLVDEEISIGDYVLTNGVLPALVWIDAVVRLLPGVLGDDRSAQEDSFSAGGLDHPHYTRPEVFAGWPVPPVLLSGNHAAIQKWRAEQALEQTRIKRPDLIERFSRQQAQQ